MVDLLSIMQKHQLHSEHAAMCFLDAQRKERKKKKEAAMKIEKKKSCKDSGDL